MIIYKTINLLNNKFYIGQDKYNDPNYLGSGTVLYKAIKKYGIENFKKEILEYCYSKEELNEREIFWIESTKCQDKNIGYNIANGGHGGFTGLHSDETKLKMSISAKKRKRKPHSKETKRKIGLAHKGKIVSKETRKLISKKSKGRTWKLTEETKLKMSKANKGKKYSEERKRKISESLKKYWENKKLNA